MGLTSHVSITTTVSLKQVSITRCTDVYGMIEMYLGRTWYNFCIFVLKYAKSMVNFTKIQLQPVQHNSLKQSSLYYSESPSIYRLCIGSQVYIFISNCRHIQEIVPSSFAILIQCPTANIRLDHSSKYMKCPGIIRNLNSEDDITSANTRVVPNRTYLNNFIYFQIQKALSPDIWRCRVYILVYLPALRICTGYGIPGTYQSLESKIDYIF